jgi:tetratricopeptide (TPR) repeat protein
VVNGARAIAVIATTVAAAISVGGCARRRAARAPTDYDRELMHLDASLRAKETKATATAAGADAAAEAPRLLERAALLYRRAALTGATDDFAQAQQAVTEARRGHVRYDELPLVAANVDFALHRLPEARAALQEITAPELGGEAASLAAAIDIEEGRYARAAEALQRALARERGWEALARLAHLRALTGDRRGAEALYREAENALTVKELRAYAWVNLQHGRLLFDEGRAGDALGLYQRADRAFGGDWRIAAHIAEALAAIGRIDDAEAAYKAALAAHPSPELAQALGDLYVFAKRPADAEPLYRRAEDDYRAAIDRGGAQYLHHLAGFYADVRRDGARAVAVARRDRDLRPDSVSARDGLGWALFRAGRIADANAEADATLATGTKDAHLLFHAALIRLAAGRAAEGSALLAEAAAINPGHETTFHVHR